MRNISFMLTTDQVRDSRPGHVLKDVTRRLGWWGAQVGDIYMGVEKGQGIPKGGKIARIRPVQITSVRFEPVQAIVEQPIRDGVPETVSEGFPDMDPWEFLAFFCKHNRCGAYDMCNRLGFRYLCCECLIAWHACGCPGGPRHTLEGAA